MFFGDELNVVWNYKYLFIISYFKVYIVFFKLEINYEIWALVYFKFKLFLFLGANVLDIV